jgi:hypothetical protein
MIEQGMKQKVEYTANEYTKLVSKIFEEIAISIHHELKHSGIKVELKENYIHAYFLEEELIFKCRPYIHDEIISGRITVYHRQKGLDGKLLIKPIAEFYFDINGNVYKQPDMKSSLENIGIKSDVYSIIIESASILIESDFFSQTHLEETYID